MTELKTVTLVAAVVIRTYPQVVSVNLIFFFRRIETSRLRSVPLCCSVSKTFGFLSCREEKMAQFPMPLPRYDGRGSFRRFCEDFNPRTAGGGRISPPPLRFFADSEKTAARSAAKFAIAVQPTI